MLGFFLGSVSTSNAVYSELSMRTIFMTPLGSVLRAVRSVNPTIPLNSSVTIS